jgi:hypothetical protein
MSEDRQAGAFTSAARAPAAVDRRGAARFSSNLRIVCYPAAGGLAERRLARLRNVSKTGIGLHVDRRWEPGTALVVEVQATADKKPRLLRVRVIHAKPQVGGCFLVGCLLETALTDEELQGLLGA